MTNGKRWISGFVFAILLSVLPAQAQKTDLLLVSDIEGVQQHIKTMVKNGDLSFDAQGPVIHQPTIFEGDIMRRDLYGRYAKRLILSLMDRFPEGSNQPIYAGAIIGNHEGNEVVLEALGPSLQIGLIPEYNKWLADKGVHDSPVQRLDWWAKTYVVENKVYNFWVEYAAETLKMDPKEFVNRYSNAGKLTEEQLQQFVSKEKMAEEFYRFYQAEGRKYLSHADILKVFQLPANEKLLVFHSGMLSKDNLGMVPDRSRPWHKLSPGKGWTLRWADDLRRWKNESFQMIDLLKESFNREPDLEKKIEFANELRTLQVAKELDAGYDPNRNVLNPERNSLVYPDPNMMADNELPGLHDQESIDALVADDVAITAGGHDPVGSVAIPFKGYATGSDKYVIMVMGDTSYSKIEGMDRQALSEGVVKITGVLPDGTHYYSEVPTYQTRKKWVESNDPELLKRVAATDRIGMSSLAYQVAGFKGKYDSVNKKFVPDYGNYVLVRQVGRDFDYRVVDEYHFTQTDKAGNIVMKLAQPSTDWAGQYQRAEQIAAETLIANGKSPLTLDQSRAALQGKEVILLTGPAGSSYGKVKNSITGYSDNVEALLNWMATQDIRADDSHVRVLWTGGTTGFETDYNLKVAEKVNIKRQASGKRPVERIGGGTAMSNGSELDKQIHDFVLTGALGWNDYMKKSVEFLATINTPYPIEVRIAGGGPILDEQIPLLLQAQKRYPGKFKLVFYQGVTLRDPTLPSATDRWLNEHYFKDPSKYPEVKVIRVEEYNINCDEAWTNAKGLAS